jgi:hypothetical protein
LISAISEPPLFPTLNQELTKLQQKTTEARANHVIKYFPRSHPLSFDLRSFDKAKLSFKKPSYLNTTVKLKTDTTVNYAGCQS